MSCCTELSLLKHFYYSFEVSVLKHSKETSFCFLSLYLRITKLHVIIQVLIQSGKSLSERLSLYLILLYKCKNNT